MRVSAYGAATTFRRTSRSQLHRSVRYARPIIILPYSIAREAGKGKRTRATYALPHPSGRHRTIPRRRWWGDERTREERRASGHARRHDAQSLQPAGSHARGETETDPDRGERMTTGQHPAAQEISRMTRASWCLAAR